MASGDLRQTKTGRPCQLTVILWPGSTPERSSLTVPAAATSAVGFIVSINGQTAAPTATAPVPAVA